MKKTICIVVLILLSQLTIVDCFGQSISRKVISTAGGTLTGGGNQIDFTIGETAITSLSAGGNQITQGFEQPNEQPQQGNVLCRGSKVSDLTVIDGVGVKWYDSATATKSLTTQTVISDRTYYYTQTINGVESTRTAFNVTVDPTSIAGLITGASGIICYNSGKLLTLSDTHRGTVQWQSAPLLSTGTFGTFTDIFGETGNTLNTGNLTATTYFRAVVTSGVCSSKNTAPVTVVVSPTATAGNITSSDEDGYVCKYVVATVAGGVEVTNSTILTLNDSVGLISWYKSTNGGTTWSHIAGQTMSSLVVNNLTATTMFKAKSTSGACYSYTEPVTINVFPVAQVGEFTADSNGYANVSKVCVGNKVRFTIKRDFGGTGEFQTSTTSATGPWTTVGTNSPAYTMTNVQGANNSKIYIRTITTSDATCPSNPKISAVKTITVTGVSVPGTLSGGKALCVNTGGALKLAGYTGLLQWMYSIDGGDNYSPIIGGTALAPSTANTGFTTTSSGISASFVVTNVTQSVQFKVRVINGTCSEEYSNVQAFTLGDPVVGGTISGTGTVCSGTGAILTLTGAVGAIQWYKSPVTIAGQPTGVWTAQSGKISSTLATGNLTASTAYKAIATICTTTDESDAHVVIVDKGCVSKFVPEESSYAKPSLTVVAYPNPFNESFNLRLTTSSDAKVGIMVYDMLGKLLEEREVIPSEVSELNIGTNYPTGIYNVIFTQEEEIKILRVIKQ